MDAIFDPNTFVVGVPFIKASLTDQPIEPNVIDRKVKSIASPA